MTLLSQPRRKKYFVDVIILIKMRNCYVLTKKYEPKFKTSRKNFTCSVENRTRTNLSLKRQRNASLYKQKISKICFKRILRKSQLANTKHFFFTFLLFCNYMEAIISQRITFLKQNLITKKSESTLHNERQSVIVLNVEQ